MQNLNSLFSQYHVQNLLMLRRVSCCLCLGQLDRPDGTSRRVFTGCAQSCEFLFKFLYDRESDHLFYNQSDLGLWLIVDSVGLSIPVLRFNWQSSRSLCVLADVWVQRSGTDGIMALMIMLCNWWQGHYEILFCFCWNGQWSMVNFGGQIVFLLEHWNT